MRQSFTESTDRSFGPKHLPLIRQAMAAQGAFAQEEVKVTRVTEVTESRRSAVHVARMKGYEGDACGECGNFTLLRNGTCMKCDTCGTTSGCS